MAKLSRRTWGGITLAIPASFEYVLYFGRFSEKKGVETLTKVCKTLTDIPFIFAGKGPLDDKVKRVANIKDVGFQSGASLGKLIKEAAFSVYPSEWYENCPFSVMESQIYGTPVVGADIGGITELIEKEGTGDLFSYGNAEELSVVIDRLWNTPALIEKMRKECQKAAFDNLDIYSERLVPIYGGITLTIYSSLKYVLYFGRYSAEKEISTLCSACRELSDIPFICAGKGPLESEVDDVPNMCNIGFQPQSSLKRLVKGAKFVVVPSEVYESFGLSAIESISCGTPVIGSDIGGLKEIIGESKAGAMFKAGDSTQLRIKVDVLWKNENARAELIGNCKVYNPVVLDEYIKLLFDGIYNSSEKFN